MPGPLIITKRLTLRPANNDEDLSTFLSLLSPDDYMYQFGHEYSEDLLDGHNFKDNGGKRRVDSGAGEAWFQEDSDGDPNAVE